MTFETKRLPAEADVHAPDGSEVRFLLQVSGGSMAQFELKPGLTSIPVIHKTVEELWFFISGRGEMWRKDDAGDEVVALVPGVCISIPVGTAFQFRSFGPDPLAAVAVTMPPWPGEGEASDAPGKWEPRL